MQRESAWMGLADISLSLGSHHDPKISAPPSGARTLIPSEGKGVPAWMSSTQLSLEGGGGF